jgi:hypothetical protein
MDGRKYYAISNDFNPRKGNHFVQQHVLPKLESSETSPHLFKNPRTIAAEISGFTMGTSPQFYADCGGYDWIVLNQLYGDMSRFPKHFQHFYHDIQSLAIFRGIDSQWPKQDESLAHHALSDAIDCKNKYEWIMGQL